MPLFQRQEEKYSMKRIITFGEIMLRLAPPRFDRFLQADTFEIDYGGGEANVAVSLANYGHDVVFMTKLPQNDIGQAAINSLRRFGVDTTYIARGGNRVGIYFLETGVSMRPSKVIYDREGSSISMAEISDFDFENAFQDAKWFHFTGITPAISDKAAELIEAALIYAKKRGLTVSCDLNYRGKLWSPDKAQHIMKSLMKYVDICIGNEEDAEKCLGYYIGDVTKGGFDLANYKKLFDQMIKDYGFKYIATSLRTSISASDNMWSGITYDGKEFYQAREYDVRIVDRVGGGDSFAAGFIHGLIKYNKDHKLAIEFAVAASALKHTILGDYNLVSENEVLALLNGDKSGRVQR